MKTKLYFDLFNCIKGLLRDIFELKHILTCQVATTQFLTQVIRLVSINVIQGFYAKGTLEQNLVKVQEGDAKFFVIGFLEY